VLNWRESEGEKLEVRRWALKIEKKEAVFFLFLRRESDL